MDGKIVSHALVLLSWNPRCRCRCPAAADLRGHVQYVTEFLEPGVGQTVGIGFDETRIRRDLDYLRRVPDQADGSFTQIIYRAHGVKPGS